MISLIKKLLGIGPKVDLSNVMANGGIIIDVRTPAEYAGGAVKGSLNIPLANLSGQLSKIKKDKPIITCCASGMRSSSARSLLLANGYKEVYNGGSWFNLKKFEK
ncbi:MAG: rhodanese-like domain-containing protein [Taibaiella sp.]|nr:rhodanese-like domain-containing protein [Taibaiella sp.]